VLFLLLQDYGWISILLSKVSGRRMCDFLGEKKLVMGLDDIAVAHCSYRCVPVGRLVAS